MPDGYGAGVLRLWVRRMNCTAIHAQRQWALFRNNPLVPYVESLSAQGDRRILGADQRPTEQMDRHLSDERNQGLHGIDRGDAHSRLVG